MVYEVSRREEPPENVPPSNLRWAFILRNQSLLTDTAPLTERSVEFHRQKFYLFRLITSMTSNNRFHGGLANYN